MRWLRDCAFWPVPQLLFPFFALHQRKRSANITDVSESLRKISQSLTGVSIDLLAIKTHIIMVAVKRVHQIASLLDCTAAQGEILCLPKATNRECALRWQSF